ncbi:DUF4422 domain-containing protein [Acinetobacter baumannii]|uniref:DUF4422 domain-containing protein n=1 Tax=Acinetobacter baumannii TaxID=470 RepID=UPI003988EC81
MKTEIYIATHKAYTFPDIPEYIPIHVGKALTELDLNIQGDNTGENILNLNKSFCELIALYWMWKNSDAHIVGLAHYRRYLVDNLNYKKDPNECNYLISKLKSSGISNHNYLGERFSNHKMIMSYVRSHPELFIRVKNYVKNIFGLFFYRYDDKYYVRKT